ncbi:MAG: DUF4340 domain-containing protein [Planctomycetes bacterium]|nr:DUF4340 domain-containing protein [Planctomycetota bacterium]
MNGKTIGLLLLAAVALGGVWALTRESVYTGPGATPDAFAGFDGIDPSGVRSVKIAHGDTSVELTRVGDGWTIPSYYGYAATTPAIDKLLKGIRRLEYVQTRAVSASSHADFDLTADQAMRLELVGTGSGLPVTLLVGKSAASGQGMPQTCFVRFPDDDRVFEVKPNLQFDAGLYTGREKPESWADKSVFKKPADADVERIALQFDGQSIEIVAKPRPDEPVVPDDPDSPPAPKPAREYRVVVPSEFDADEATVRSMTGRVGSIYASDLVDPSKLADYGLEPPSRTARVEFSTGDPMVLHVGNAVAKEKDSDPEKYYARLDGDPRVFTVGAYVRDAIFKTVDELTPPPPTTVEPTTVEPTTVEPTSNGSAADDAKGTGPDPGGAGGDTSSAGG